MDNWSPESFVSLPSQVLGSTKTDIGSEVSVASKSFHKIHGTVKDPTVSQYLNLIRTYQVVHARESTKIRERQSKLAKGVSKLKEAKEVVKKLKGEAAQQEIQLAEKQQEANDALQMITDTMKNANLQVWSGFQCSDCFLSQAS